jgi:hypothetical protein
MELTLNVKFSAAPDLLEALALLAGKSPRLDQLDRMIEGAHDRIGNLSAALALQGLKTYPTDDRESYPVPELNANAYAAGVREFIENPKYQAVDASKIPAPDLEHENFAERERRVTRPDLTENGAPVPNIKPAVPPGYLPAENRTADQAERVPASALEPVDPVEALADLDKQADAVAAQPDAPKAEPAAAKQPAAERPRTPSGRLSRAKTPEQKQQALAEKHAAKKAENGQTSAAPRGLYETTGDEPDEDEPDTSGEPGTGNDGRYLAELPPPVDPAEQTKPVNGSAPAPIAKGLPTGELQVEDVRRATQDAVFRNAANRDVIREMLNEIGVERASDLDPKYWTDYVQKVAAL